VPGKRCLKRTGQRIVRRDGRLICAPCAIAAIRSAGSDAPVPAGRPRWQSRAGCPPASRSARAQRRPPRARNQRTGRPPPEGAAACAAPPTVAAAADSRPVPALTCAGVAKATPASG